MPPDHTIERQKSWDGSTTKEKDSFFTGGHGSLRTTGGKTGKGKSEKKPPNWSLKNPSRNRKKTAKLKTLIRTIV